MISEYELDGQWNEWHSGVCGLICRVSGGRDRRLAVMLKNINKYFEVDSIGQGRLQ